MHRITNQNILKYAIMKTEIYDNEGSVRKHCLLYDHRDFVRLPFGGRVLSTNHSLKIGHYCFNKGTVVIYRNGNWIDYEFVYNGRFYTRVILDKPYTDIGIARKAGEFAREIINKQS